NYIIMYMYNDHGEHFIYSLCVISVSPIESDSWRVKIPPLMVGLEGSCVVIPCHFNYPGPSKKASDFTGIWLTDFNEKVFHSVTSKISQMFQGRTSLTGDLSHRNCSLKINPLHHTDKGTFMFVFLFYDLFSWSGKKVTTSCSVSHSCPSDPPHITWNYRGILNSQSQEQTKGQWTMTSTLSFIPSKVDHNQPLICTAEFPGGKRVNIQTTLNVKCESNIKSSVCLYGKSFLCFCLFVRKFFQNIVTDATQYICIIDPPEIVEVILESLVLCIHFHSVRVGTRPWPPPVTRGRP
uniref:Ig-like domain-containing protein n=1 Tax=Electrophorus electricus TaxID=8005 RepID=A0AAY5E8P4_ELEEL